MPPQSISTPNGEFDVLRDGVMSVDGRMPWSSNATFLVTLTAEDLDNLEDHDNLEDLDNLEPVDSVELVDLPLRDPKPVPSDPVKAIYKPHKGERPLWDFPSGLYQREVAMYELAAFLGWNVIPRTVLREGEFGIGSVQLFVDADFEQHYFTMLESIETRPPKLLNSLRTLATLDLLANNADRKSGHVLVDGDNGIWGIDHGLCFHEEFKLRTVMWDFAGDDIPASLTSDIARLAGATPGQLGALDQLLDPEEIGALIDRARRIIRKPRFPAPHSNHAYPWPMV